MNNAHPPRLTGVCGTHTGGGGDLPAGQHLPGGVGGSHRQRATGAGPIEWHSCSGIQTFRKNISGFRPLPPPSLSNQWPSEAKPLDYRSLREGRVGRGWPESALHGQIPQSAAGVQPASGRLPWEEEEPPALPPGAQTERAEGGRLEAKTRK